MNRIIRSKSCFWIATWGTVVFLCLLFNQTVTAQSSLTGGPSAQDTTATTTNGLAAPLRTSSLPPAYWQDAESETPQDESADASNEEGEGEDEEDEDEDEDLFDLDLEDLAKVKVGKDPVFASESLNNEVMSVDGTSSTVGQSPAAVFVLTGDMIRRSGVRTIPDALRLVPGVQVARLNSQAYSVSIRGFAGAFNNKVLVQIDGRMIYGQTYGGVLWDSHEIILEDIDRIEVIRGPGATVWGENAVTGVINIITKSAEDTIGNYFTSGYGSEENEFHAFSLGRKSGDLNYRIYGKYAERNKGLILDSIAVPFGYFPDDGGYNGRIGYRSDYVPSESDRVTMILDFHRGGDHRVAGQEYAIDQSHERHLMTSGAYTLLRWQHEFHEDHDVTIQAYYDRTNRDWIATLEKQDNYEIDIKNRQKINERRERVSGLTWRRSKGRFFGSDYEHDGFGGLNVVDPHLQLDRLDVDYFGGFIQEKWTLQEDKWFTWLGTKVGWNSLNGVNAQPSARSLYVLGEKSVVWGSVSRAVRLPTRFDAGIQLEDPTVNLYVVERTAKDFLQSEEVIAYEMGYRRQPNEFWNWEVSAFYNDYTDMFETGPMVSYNGGPFLPAPLDQLRGDGKAYGVELNANAKMTSNWDLRCGYSYLNLDIDLTSSGLTNFGPHLDNERSPDNMFYIQSQMQVSPRLQWDNTLRYVDKLPGTFLWEFDGAGGWDRIDGTPSYVQLDTRLNYRVNDRLDLSVVGRNLLNSAQAEFGGDLFFSRQIRSYLERSIYVQASWKTGRVSRKTKEERRKKAEQQRQKAEQERQRTQQEQRRTFAEDPDRFLIR